ncbi:MAG TPA: deoxyribodipyrimidine photo-lyase [Acidobacteriota bacterium]|nr:deoxyribodipyrimidine photo-lyase [Acidobacteriota bacterium]
MSRTVLVWLRQDLRLADNPALETACREASQVVPVFLWAPGEHGAWAPGGASRWWLHQSLQSLDRSLRSKGSQLILRKGSDSLRMLQELFEESGAEAVYWNRLYEPLAVKRDKSIKAALKERGLEARSFKAGLLFEPWEVETASGGPYQVYTPFSKQLFERTPPPPAVEPPANLKPPGRWPDSAPLQALELEPRYDWAGGLERAWNPGEEGAFRQLARFEGEGLDRYHNLRNRTDLSGVSRLSPHLHHGEISPRQVWHSVLQAQQAADSRQLSRGAWGYLRQVLWREFAYHLLFHFPHTAEEPLREKYQEFPWVKDEEALQAWQRGRTGYPMVDAGMRQLWETGWMHNRVRMIVASFLVKDLLIHWVEGARWFWDTLVDADLANNTLGWQWTAGCGADAAPYFRIFNPVSQGQSHDPQGEYVRRWVPELSQLSKRWIHQPWEAPQEVLEEAGVRLGQDYPRPMVDHQEARKRALSALDEMKEQSRG